MRPCYDKIFKRCAMKPEPTRSRQRMAWLPWCAHRRNKLQSSADRLAAAWAAPPTPWVAPPQRRRPNAQLTFCRRPGCGSTTEGDTLGVSRAVFRGPLRDPSIVISGLPIREQTPPGTRIANVPSGSPVPSVAHSSKFAEVHERRRFAEKLRVACLAHGLGNTGPKTKVPVAQDSASPGRLRVPCLLVQILFVCFAIHNSVQVRVISTAPRLRWRPRLACQSPKVRSRGRQRHMQQLCRSYALDDAAPWGLAQPHASKLGLVGVLLLSGPKLRPSAGHRPTFYDFGQTLDTSRPSSANVWAKFARAQPIFAEFGRTC